jgi:hypothetical protein
VTFDTHGPTRDEISVEFPALTYEVEDGTASCKLGVKVDRLFSCEREARVKMQKIFR